MPAELLRGDPDISDVSQNETLSLTPAQERAIDSITRTLAPADASAPTQERGTTFH